MRTYKQLTQEQRYYIFQLNKKDFTQVEIALELGVLADADHVIPVEHLFGRIDDARDRVESRPVRSRLSDRDGAFSVPSKRWPVTRYRNVEIDQASIDRHVKQGRHHALAGGHAQCEGLGLERRAVTVARTAREVRDQLPTMVDGHSDASGAVQRSAMPNRLPKRTEIRVAVPANLHTTTE